MVSIFLHGLIAVILSVGVLSIYSADAFSGHRLPFISNSWSGFS